MAAIAESTCSSSARPSLFFYSGFDDHHETHFLDACNLCSKPLGFNSDIYMYRGNTPFCSKECRQEQINLDVAKEKSWKVSSRSLRKSEQSTAKKTVRTGTVAVA